MNEIKISEEVLMKAEKRLIAVIVWKSDARFVDTIKSLLRRLNIRTGIIFRASAPDINSARKIFEEMEGNF
ncbi:MAG: hypothetical protein J7J99_03625 [Thermoprotei archaeon]|nr:hypothetical protein [Thermoprotei archaeon]